MGTYIAKVSSVEKLAIVLWRTESEALLPGNCQVHKLVRHAKRISDHQDNAEPEDPSRVSTDPCPSRAVEKHDLFPKWAKTLRAAHQTHSPR
jgi:hypothetical protein